MAKAKLAIKRPVEIAEKIVAVSREIAAFEEQIKPIKAKRDELRQEMLESLRANRVESISTAYGVNFTRATRSSLTVTDPAAAKTWCLANGCIRPDLIQATKLLKGTGALPKGFEDKFTDYLSITGLNGGEE